jgi:hypothetical protein
MASATGVSMGSTTGGAVSAGADQPAFCHSPITLPSVSVKYAV